MTFAPTAKPLFVDLRYCRPVSLALSVNAVTIKTPALPPEPAVAYLVGWHEGSNQAGAFVFLHYAASGEAVSYAPDPLPFARVELGEQLAAGREFLERMGYMLDDIDLGKLTPQRLQQLLTQLPVFHADLKKFHAARDVEDLPTGSVEELDVESTAPALTPATPRDTAARSVPVAHGAGAAAGLSAASPRVADAPSRRALVQLLLSS